MSPWWYSRLKELEPVGGGLKRGFPLAGKLTRRMLWLVGENGGLEAKRLSGKAPLILKPTMNASVGLGVA